MKNLILMIFAAAILLCGCNNTENDPSESSDINSSAQLNAEEMVERALDADEWPQMDYVTEQNYVNALFDERIVLDDCEDFCLASNVISAQLNKILVIKPKPDKADAIEDAMDEYYKYVTTEGAFYPDQQASAAGSVKGKTSNGYIYIIVHKNGTLIADKMLT